MDKIAALYVATDGPYYGLTNVEPWDIETDAREYAGPYPVVAHPPCQRWGKMWMGSPSYVARTGIRKKKGDDGGCFKAALTAVRTYGGVLEHPKHSHAWEFFKLTKPPQKGGWVKADDYGGFTCCVEQGRYGHWFRKPTWLYTVGSRLPDLRWGVSDAVYPEWAVEKYGLAKVKRMGEMALKGGGVDSAARIHTPTDFRDLLISIARSVNMSDNLDKKAKEERRRQQRRASKTKFTCHKCGLNAWAKETATLGCWKCGIEMVDSDG